MVQAARFVTKQAPKRGFGHQPEAYFVGNEDDPARQARDQFEQCGALAVSGKGDAGWGKSATKLTAETQALAGCDNDACKVVVSDCNSEE